MTALAALAALAVLAALCVLGLLGAAALTTRLARRAEAALPPAGRFIEVPGARLHVVEAGALRDGRTPILMLHGLAGQLHHFRYSLVDALAEETRVVAVDRPGSGYSTREPGCATALEDQADAIAALMDRLGFERALLVGHSLGGALSLAVALRHPTRVAGLALLAPLTTMPGGSPEVFRSLQVPPALRSLIARTVAIPAFVSRREALMRLVFGPEDAPGDYARRGGGLLSLRPQQFQSAAEDYAAVPRSLTALEARYGELVRATPAPPLPIAVLYGREDRVLDYRPQGEGFIARVPHARLELVTGGHMLPVTQPARCAEFIRRAAGFE
jgi:pimeloyl-ACP methyl ester carboxylesterase